MTAVGTGCAGVPARMTAAGAGCAGVPARTTDEARDPGGQLFCRLSASRSRCRDSVDRRCIARNGAVARFMALQRCFSAERKKEKKEKNTPPTVGKQPEYHGIWGIDNLRRLCYYFRETRSVRDNSRITFTSRL